MRVGPDVVTDGAVLVTRGMEDWVTWAEGAVREKVLGWRGEKDDFR